MEIWWNVGSKNGETRRWQVCHRWWYGLWHSHRIEPFSEITIILEQGKWSIAKDIGPFFKRCNARHRQTFFNLVNVSVFDIASICIHGEELLRQFTFHQKKTGEDLTLKMMFDRSEKLIVEHSDGIFGVTHINWENSPWKQLSLVSDEEVISLSRAKVYVSSDSVCDALERWIRTQNQILFEKNSWVGSKNHHNTERWTQLTESRWNSSGTSSQDSPHCSSSTKSKSSWTKWATQHTSKDELSSCRCSMTSYGDLKTMNGNALLMPHLWLYLHIDFQQEVGHSSDLDQKRSGILLTTKDHEENGTESLNWWWSNSEKSGHPVFRATSPLSRGTLKSRGGGKLSIHFSADWETIETVLSHNYFCQSAQYLRSSLRCVWGTQYLSNKNGETCAGRTIWPIVWASKLVDVNTSPSTEDPAQEDLLQKYQERVEGLSQQNRVIKFCTDAGFLTTVEVGQYFMTKDTEEFSQFTDSVACREYTLPRDEKSSGPKGWIRGNTKIGPVLEVTTSYLQGN